MIPAKAEGFVAVERFDCHPRPHQPLKRDSRSSRAVAAFIKTKKGEGESSSAVDTEFTLRGTGGIVHLPAFLADRVGLVRRGQYTRVLLSELWTEVREFVCRLNRWRMET